MFFPPPRGTSYDQGMASAAAGQHSEVSYKDLQSEALELWNKSDSKDFPSVRKESRGGGEINFHYAAIQVS